MKPLEALAAALAEQSPDDDDLRDWLTDRAEFVADALAAEGFVIVDAGRPSPTCRPCTAWRSSLGVPGACGVTDG